MDKLRLFVLLSCVTSSTWASVIPTQKAGELHPKEEVGENDPVVVPTQLNMPTDGAPVHMEVDVSEDSMENQNPLLRETKARDPNKPNSNKPNEGSHENFSKPSNHARPNKPHKNPPPAMNPPAQKLDVAKSSTAPKPSLFPNRDKPSKPNNPQDNSSSAQKPEKPTSSSLKPPQRNTGKTESNEIQPESTDSVALPKPEGNSNSVRENLPSVQESQNSVESNTNGEKNVERQNQNPLDSISILGTLIALSNLPTMGGDISSGPAIPISTPNVHSHLTLDTNANISVNNNKDLELEHTKVEAAVDNKNPQTNVDPIQNQLQEQIELIQSQIQNQQQEAQAHVNQPQSASGAAVTFDSPTIPAVVVEETSAEESEKASNELTGLPDKKDLHKQIVSEGQYVVQVQNVAHSTHSIVTNDPSKFAQDSVKLELMKPINSLYTNSKDKAQAMMDSIVSKVSPSPVKEIPACKGKETINLVSKKPEELVYEVEEIVEVPEVVSIVSLQIPADSNDASPSVEIPEIVSPVNQIDQNKMPQLPPNIVKLISQLHALTNQKKQGSTAPVQVLANDQTSNEGIVTTPDNQATTTPTVSQAVADLITAMLALNNSSRPNNGVTLYSGSQNTPSAGVNVVPASPYVGSVPGSYAVPINYVYTYPQLIPYVAPYVLVNGIASPAANVATNAGTDESQEFSPSSQTLSPDSDTFVEELQGVSIVPMGEIEKQEKENTQSKNHNENHINTNNEITNKEKPGKPVNNNQSKPSSVNGRPQNSAATQGTASGQSPTNSAPNVGTFGNSNNKPQNIQNNNNVGSKPQTSGTANSLNTGDKPEQEQTRPPFSGKPPVTTSNNKPQGSSSANNNPQSSSTNSANRPEAVTGFGGNAVTIIPYDSQQQSNNNSNDFVLSTMGEFLENESQQQQGGDKEEVPAVSVPGKPSSHPHATHGHGAKPQALNGGNKPRPGSHGFLIPPKSADNEVEEYIQPNNEIENVVAALPAGNAQSPTTFEIVVNPEPVKNSSVSEKNNQVHKNPVPAFSSPPKPTAANGKKPNKTFKA